MKRIISMFLIILINLSILCFFSVSKANSAPVYDETYNNNAGAFYANGTPITIDIDSENNTVVYWNGGKQIVPESVTIFGGGTEGTSYENTNITMENGTVSIIYGGGISLEEDKISSVGTSNITINNGNILVSLMGGGLLYTNTENANITVNGGKILAVVGGGAANAKISGVSYSAGNSEDLKNSKNRTTNTNVVINEGTIDSTPSSYGLVFGGGQGLSYTKNANVTINSGDLSKAYITSGGSNGYTENGNIQINGGNIKLLQTTNRGIVDSAKIKITNGNIENAYIGGEPDPSVTGKINNVELDVLGGKIKNLDSGTSEAKVIEVDKNNYKVIFTENSIENNNIAEKSISISYEFRIKSENMKMFVNAKEQIITEIKTNPTGHKELFDLEGISWKSDNSEIVSVDENGVVNAKNTGKTIITAKYLEQEDTIEIEVIKLPNVILWIVLVILLTFVLSIIYLIAISI